MAKQVVQAVKGTRDFYPEDMAFRNWLYGKVKEVSEKFGYQEFDGPEIEYLDLYADKTSQEILRGQTFNIQAKDEKAMILRPELTPTFARMVAQKSQELPKPIRWFSFGKVFRYEQPQKGRVREFFQWEINLLGPESPEADAEILAIAVEYFKAIGLSAQEIVIKVNDREFMQNQLKEIGTSEKQICQVLRFIDRRDKITSEQFKKDLLEVGLSPQQVEGVEIILTETNYSKSPWLQKVFASLKKYPGVMDFIEFDPTIVRGFDYYTRTVFEAWDRQEKFGRSIFGGGRFDNLTAQVGGERIPGVGFAIGNVPSQIILEQYNKIPRITPSVAKVLVTVFSLDLYAKSLEITNQLRELGIDTEFWLDAESKLDKQLKYADQKGIPYALIIGPEEAEKGLVTLKNLSTKDQETLKIEAAIDTIKK